MAIATIYQGMVTAGERQIVIRPNNVQEPKYGLLYTHGAGGTADAMGEYGGACRRTTLVADAGVAAVSGDYGGKQTWGNDAAMRSMTQGYDWLQTQPGVKKGKVAIAGGSMGGLNALVWAAANPDKVSCISIYIPVLNPSQIHARNLGGLAPFIDSAYGGKWDTNTQRSLRDPLYMAGMGKYAGLPIRIHYGTTDPWCLPENAPAFADAAGGLVELVALQGGHEESTELRIDRDAERDFILSHAG